MVFKAIARTYGEPVWTWTEDAEGGYTVSAEFTTNDGAAEFRETVNAQVTSETTAASCTEAGAIVYTASVTFRGETYTDTKTV
ncbi:MAG: hypothetical protein II655_06955, partial [Thermoguttaceae bacterium]|nr:hypothetical protein [Thermoguttaceae bacterium]